MGSHQFFLNCPSCRDGKISIESQECRQCHFAADVAGRVLVLERSPTDDYSQDGSIVQREVLDSHFWFSARNKLIRMALERRVGVSHGRRFVEFGCGNGFVLSALEAAGWQVAGVDMHIEGLRNAEMLVSGPLICARIERVSFVEPVDAIGLFDVIEHLENDEEILRQAMNQLRPGGALVVTVPALMSLWSHFDVLAGHKRRYSRNQLLSLLRKVGLQDVDVKYAFSFSVPLLWLQRRLIRVTEDSTSDCRRQYLRPPNFLVNRLLSALATLERWCLHAGVNPPIGTSLIGIAKRRTASD